MGSPGIKVFRHKGRYFVWSYSYNGGMEVLGKHLYDAIPKEPNALNKWADQMRSRLDDVYSRYALADHDPITNGLRGRDEADSLDVERVVICSNHADFDYYLEDLWAEELYGFDLDSMVFERNTYPMYHLDNMPPFDTLLQDWSYTSFRDTTPEQFRLDIFRLRVHVTNAAYTSSSPARECNTLENPCDILSAHGGRPPSLEVATYHAADYAMLYALNKFRMLDLYRFACSVSLETSSAHDRRTAYMIAAKFLLPLQTSATYWSRLERNIRQEMLSAAKSANNVWFARRHISIALGTHLQDESHAQLQTSRLIEKIMANDNTEDVLYGVLFSVLHCVIVRVDKKANQIARTKVLEFLPALWFNDLSAFGNERRITSAMEIMARIGHLRAPDDVEYFYEKLSARWWEGPEETMSPARNPLIVSEQPSIQTSSSANKIPSGGPLQLPLEIWTMIVNEITLPETLYYFALASRITMVAAIPRLRYPSVLDRLSYYPNSFILNSIHSKDVCPAMYATYLDADDIGPALAQFYTEFMKEAAVCLLSDKSRRSIAYEAIEYWRTMREVHVNRHASEMLEFCLKRR